MGRLLRGWRTWWSFSSHDRAQWLQGWLLLLLVALGLQLIGLRGVQIVLCRLSPKTPGRVDRTASIAIARLFYSAVRWSPLPVSCLAGSLALGWLLQNQGLEANLRIGVAKRDGHLAAHAWVEHGGVSLENENVISRFVPFRSPPIHPGNK